MGFDLYGLNPHNPNDAVRPEHLDWSTKPSDDVRDEYFKKVDEYETEVVGSYFRANVWYWRPIWSFVCGASYNILTEKDMEQGSYNGGHIISKTKSKRIAARLRGLDKKGIIQKWEDEMMASFNKAEKHNKELQKTMDAITKNCKEEHGDDLVPRDYPEPYRTQWNEVFDKRDWGANYPPSRDYIMEFAEFAEQSGGFEIC